MDTVGVERKERERVWTVFMGKHGKKQLYLQCFNVSGIEHFPSCLLFCQAAFNVIRKYTVLEFKVRFCNNHFHSNGKCGHEWTLATVVFENVGV